LAHASPSVLFVCLGNICRSPTAEGVFARKAQQRGLKIRIDSAGTAGFHKGAAPDKRSQQVAQLRGYDLKSLKCRRVSDEDYINFDYIIAMDKANVRDLKRKCPQELQHKISLFMAHCQSNFDEVPDPYYGGGKGFEIVLDLVEQASDGFLQVLAQRTREA
jgi:protein-tyrosine phosphatase